MDRSGELWPRCATVPPVISEAMRQFQSWSWLELAGAGWSWLELAGAGWSWLELAGAG